MRKTEDAKADAGTGGDAAGHDNPHVSEDNESTDVASTTAVEVGGRDGPDPTRYGDWEKNGRCIDF